MDNKHMGGLFSVKVKTYARRGTVLGVLFTYLLIFQNCTKGFETLPEIAELSSTDASSQNTCMSNPEFDSCLYYKNPVAQQNGSLTSNKINMTELQTFGVNLDIDNSGFLQNSSLIVRNLQGGRANSINGSWKFSFSDDSQRLNHVSAFYWLDQTIKTMKSRTGLFYAEGKALQIIPDGTLTGWSPENNAISLEIGDGTQPMALDAGIMIHLLGEANIYYATNGAIEINTAEVHHRNCGPTAETIYANDCCVSPMGCSRAITSGASDYLVALMFPDSPTIGEYSSNKVSGFDLCNMSRDLRLSRDINATQAYQSCTQFGMTGQVYNLGTLYASIWWEIRKTLQAYDKEDFDRLYMYHLASLSSEDTFISVLEKIKSLDAAEFQGRFSIKFENEFARRMLN